jgi:hypothetical protein
MRSLVLILLSAPCDFIAQSFDHLAGPVRQRLYAAARSQRGGICVTRACRTPARHAAGGGRRARPQD